MREEMRPVAERGGLQIGIFGMTPVPGSGSLSYSAEDKWAMTAEIGGEGSVSQPFEALTITGAMGVWGGYGCACVLP